MTISGNLRTMELAELLQWLANGAKTGKLELSRESLRKKIYWDRGRVIATASSNPTEYLGHFLVSHGYIDEEVLAQAMGMQEESRMLLGKILVTIGAISEPDLDAMLKLKTQETIYEIFTWQQGDFRFVDDELPEFALVPLKISLAGLVLEGVHRIDEWARIRSVIPSPRAVVVATGPLQPPADDPFAATVLEAINDDRTIEEIALHSHAGDFHVHRVVLDQMTRSAVKLVHPRGASEEPEPAKAGELAATAVPIDATALLATGRELLAGREYEAALRHFRAALSLQPDAATVQRRVEEAKSEIHEMLEDEGIVAEVVPTLTRAIDELTTLEISPEEGFILTRINGSYDIGTLLKISPMASLDALLVFRRLAAAGHIQLG